MSNYLIKMTLLVNHQTEDGGTTAVHVEHWHDFDYPLQKNHVIWVEGCEWSFKCSEIHHHMKRIQLNEDHHKFEHTRSALFFCSVSCRSKENAQRILNQTKDFFKHSGDCMCNQCMEEARQQQKERQ